MTRPQPSHRLRDDKDLDDLFVADAGKAVSAAYAALKAAKDRTADLAPAGTSRDLPALREGKK